MLRQNTASITSLSAGRTAARQERPINRCSLPAKSTSFTSHAARTISLADRLLLRLTRRSQAIFQGRAHTLRRIRSISKSSSPRCFRGTIPLGLTRKERHSIQTFEGTRREQISWLISTQRSWAATDAPPRQGYSTTISFTRTMQEKQLKFKTIRQFCPRTLEAECLVFLSGLLALFALANSVCRIEGATTHAL